MSLMEKVKKQILKSDCLTYYAKRIVFSIYKLLGKLVSDEKYIKWQYRMKMGKKLDLTNVKTFNEKIQWLKLHYRVPVMQQCADKDKARDYVKAKGLEDILIPQIGVYDSAKDIRLLDLPPQFVLKQTNGSGFNYICKNKCTFKFEAVQKYLDKTLSWNGYYYGREWSYKGLENKIVCEAFLRDERGEVPKDYKFFCFEGEPKLIGVDIDRFGKHRRNVYDMNWNKLDLEWGYKQSEMGLPRPKALERMIEVARILSKDFIFVRVDLYAIDEKVYFGELTFYPSSGYVRFSSDEWDEKIGKLIPLEKISQYQ